MSTRSDWEAAAGEFMAAERERLGGPPTPEEVVAYAQGELPEAQAARVRALLVYYPELTSVLTEPAPAGVVDFAPRRRITPTHLLAAAASALLVLSAGLGVQVQRLSHELHAPQVLAVRDLHPNMSTRGPVRPPNLLVAGEKSSVLVFGDLPHASRYRIDQVSGTKKVWTATVATAEDEPLQLSLPRGLEPGNYRFEIYGEDDSTLLATYELRVTKAPQP